MFCIWVWTCYFFLINTNLPIVIIGWEIVVYEIAVFFFETGLLVLWEVLVWVKLTFRVKDKVGFKDLVWLKIKNLVWVLLVRWFDVDFVIVFVRILVRVGGVGARVDFVAEFVVEIEVVSKA